MTGSGGSTTTSARATLLDDEVAARIRRRGPIPFAEVMDVALYDPVHGFYAAGGEAGRRGDFLTSPEVGPLFGAVVARALDTWWDEAGRPDPFVVVESAAGSGMLARTVLAAGPDCAPALTYVLVERSAALRARHGDHLQLATPELAFPPIADPDGPDGHLVDPATGTGPRMVSLGELPAFACADVVLANELLDNLPVVLLEAGEPGAEPRWSEVRVALDAGDGDLVELLVPASPALASKAERLAPGVAAGSRIPIADAAADWVRTALDTVRAGRVLRPRLRRPDAQPRGPPVDRLAAHVPGPRSAATDPSSASGPRTSPARCPSISSTVLLPMDRDETQASFLARHGIDELVDEGRRIWHERAHIGDLEAIRGRSRVREAEALVDADGLGAFRVLEWRKG